MYFSNQTPPKESGVLKLLCLGLFSLISGAFFYLIVRGHFGFGQVDFNPSTLTSWTLKGLAWGSTPSLLHGFAFACLAIAAGQSKKSALWSWLILGSVWEVSQKLFVVLGTFDFADLASNALGVFFAFKISGLVFEGDFIRKIVRALRAPIYALGLLTCMATSYKQDVRQPIFRVTHEPVFMTYEDLRTSFVVEAPRPIAKAGKIVTIGTTMFASDPNIGIHVIDNTDPTNPKPVLFLNLPGVTDLASKDGVLFADSFIDLVAIQIDGDKPIEVLRIKDNFPWNPYQAVDTFSVRFDPASFDQKKGVVVGAKKLELDVKTKEQPNGK